MAGDDSPTIPPAKDHISPLPHEILSEVMSLATHGQEEEKSRYAFPAILYAISRRWRAVVNDSPRVWSFIVISDQRTLQDAQTRISRAKSAPLSIRIHDRGAHLDPAHVMKPLLPAAERWSDLTLVVKDIASYCPHFPTSLPTLHDLSLRDGGSEFILHLSLPRLKSMTLEVAWLCLDPSASFANLTECYMRYGEDVGHISVGKLLSHLGSALNLETLELTKPWLFDPVDREAFQSLEAVHLPRLKSLKLDSMYPWELMVFLSRLRAPVLGTLLLGFANGEPDSTTSFDIDQFAFPSLQRLTLTFGSSPPPRASLPRILLHIPEFQELSIIEADSSTLGLLLESLFVNGATRTIGARLSEISTKGISLETLEACFSDPALALAHPFPFVLKVYSPDLLTIPEGEEHALEHAKLLEGLRLVVPGVEKTDRETWWD